MADTSTLSPEDIAYIEQRQYVDFIMVNNRTGYSMYEKNREYPQYDDTMKDIRDWVKEV